MTAECSTFSFFSFFSLFFSFLRSLLLLLLLSLSFLLPFFRLESSSVSDELRDLSLRFLRSLRSLDRDLDLDLDFDLLLSRLCLPDPIESDRDLRLFRGGLRLLRHGSALRMRLLLRRRLSPSSGSLLAERDLDLDTVRDL